MRHCARREKPCRVRGKGSDTNKALNEANAETNESDNHEHQQQGLARNAGAKRRNPTDSLSDESGNVRKNGCHSHRNAPLHTNEALNKANAEANEGHDHEHKQKRIGGNDAGERADPFNSLSDKGRNVAQNGSDSDSSFLQKPPFLKFC